MHQNPMSLGHLERRKAGRVRCTQTLCQFGQVGDLSRDGCRVIAKKPMKLPEGSSVNLRIEVGGVSLLAAAKPVSCRKRGDGKYEIGFQFIGLAGDAGRELIALARAASHSSSYTHRLSA